MSIDDNLKQIRSILDNYNEYSKPLREAIVKTTEQLGEVFSDQRLREYQRFSESFSQKYNDTLSVLASIDWKGIYAKLSQIEKDVLAFSDELNKERIYLNYYYFDSIEFDKIHTLLERDAAIKWMNDNLENAVKNLSEKEFLVRHKKLIEQSYKSYKHGDYELAILGIIPALEFFIGNWMNSDKLNGEFDFKKPSRDQMEKDGLKEILEKHPDRKKRSLETNHYFEMKAMDGILEFYNGSRENRVSRNSIVHGSHDYSELENLDYVKLIYLFNSLLSLYKGNFDKGNFDIKTFKKNKRKKKRSSQ